jgi:hypothetical protein
VNCLRNVIDVEKDQPVEGSLNSIGALDIRLFQRSDERLENGQPRGNDKGALEGGEGIKPVARRILELLSLGFYRFMRENGKIEKDGKAPAGAKRILLGINKASLSTDSFISAASRLQPAGGLPR